MSTTKRSLRFCRLMVKFLLSARILGQCLSKYDGVEGDFVMKNTKRAAVIGVAVVGLVLTGCGLGEPSNAQIESTIRAYATEVLVKDGAPIDVINKKLKVTILKNNGCVPDGDKSYICDVHAELQIPKEKTNPSDSDVEIRQDDLKGKYTRSQNGWTVEEIK